MRLTNSAERWIRMAFAVVCVVGMALGMSVAISTADDPFFGEMTVTVHPTANTFLFLWNYDTGDFDWHEIDTDDVITFDAPSQAWLGIFVFDTDAGEWSSTMFVGEMH